MYAKEEDNTTTTTTTTTTTSEFPRKRKRSFFLTSCFCCSATATTDTEGLRSTTPTGDGKKKKKKKKGKFSWFSWSPFKKKKKKMEKKKPSAKKQFKGKNTKSPYSTTSQTQVNVNASQHHPSILTTISNQTKSNSSIQSKTRPNRSDSTGQLEPMAGLWVMLMTLAMMVFFGRVTAVVVLCSSFYLFPLLKAQAGRAAISREVDVNSEGYKKKVILEGLLERDSQRY